MEIAGSPKRDKKYVCDLCHYKCSKESDYKKHLMTAKHIKNQNGNNVEMIIEEKVAVEFKCHICNKNYNTNSGLWKHLKNCKPLDNEILPSADADLKILVIDLIKSNQILQQQILEVCKNGINTTINNNNHSNNKTFNLNFFLNEQCKDAMNIMDFVDTFQLQFDDLERIGEVGYVEGISNLIIDKLNSMDIYKRPIHCSDAKREIMHIKDKGVWEKDNENNDKLRLAIKHITKKNIDLIGAWTEKYPGVRYSDHRLNDKFNEIIMEAMGGKNNKTMKEGEAKIIKKISKMVLIDKRF